MGAPENSFAQICGLQTGAIQVGFAQSRLTEIGLTKVCVTENEVGQLRFLKVELRKVSFPIRVAF
jgi:hypothetical protein